MLTPVNDPKYYIADGQFINRASNIPIPDDEPVFIFRARDHYAAAIISDYASVCLNKEHQEIVENCVKDFDDFAAAHPDRMKEPDTSPLNE